MNTQKVRMILSIILVSYYLLCIPIQSFDQKNKRFPVYLAGGGRQLEYNYMIIIASRSSRLQWTAKQNRLKKKKLLNITFTHNTASLNVPEHSGQLQPQIMMLFFLQLENVIEPINHGFQHEIAFSHELNILVVMLHSFV